MKLLFTFLSLKVFRHEERETQSFYADCFYLISSQPNQRVAPIAHKFIWPRRAPKVNLSFGGRNSTNCFFLKSQNPQPTLPGIMSFTSLVPFTIWEFYFDICEWCILPARAWTPALMLHLTNPCAKRKVLSLTKSKGKIYKTKSLRNYITQDAVYRTCQEQEKIKIDGERVRERVRERGRERERESSDFRLSA